MAIFSADAGLLGGVYETVYVGLRLFYGIYGFLSNANVLRSALRVVLLNIILLVKI